MVKKPELDDDDAMFMPDLEENRRAPAFPFEDGAKRLEIRDTETLGRRAWGYLSKDERFILCDTGRLWVKISSVELEILSENLRDEGSIRWLSSSSLRMANTNSRIVGSLGNSHSVS